MNWTEERIEKLKKLWAQGLSATQIATQLGGVSRNAIIGKVHRLSLPGRSKSGGRTASSSTPKVPRAPATTVRRTPSVPQIPQKEKRIAKPPSLTAEEKTKVEEAKQKEHIAHMMLVSPRLQMEALTERTCKWPVGDPLKDDFFFCGCDASGSPYCTYHQRLAYQPVSERRQRSENHQHEHAMA